MRTGKVLLALLLVGFRLPCPAAGNVFSEIGAAKASTSVPQAANSAATRTATLSTATLDFGPQGIKMQSAPRFITLTNTGKTDLTISGVASSAPDFTLIHNCASAPDALPAGGTCTIAVRFTPAELGACSGSISIRVGPQMELLTVALSGTAVESPIALSASSLLFRTQLVGTSGQPQFVKLTNHSDTKPLLIKSVTVPPEFTLSPSKEQCADGQTLAPLAICNLSVRFSPTRVGKVENQLTITDSDSASPHKIGLLAMATGIRLSSQVLTWDTVELGAVSEPKKFDITNLGNTPVAINGIEARGDFSQNNTCGKVLAFQQSCSVTVQFKPTMPGQRAGSVLVTDSDPTIVQDVFLEGMGDVVGLSLTTIDFGGQKIGSTSPPQLVTITNRGAQNLSISALNVGGDFVMPSKSCGSTLPAGVSCQVGLSFSPTAEGARNGFLSIVSNSGTPPRRVSLTGMGK